MMKSDKLISILFLLAVIVSISLSIFAYDSISDIKDIIDDDPDFRTPAPFSVSEKNLNDFIESYKKLTPDTIHVKMYAAHSSSYISSSGKVTYVEIPQPHDWDHELHMEDFFEKMKIAAKNKEQRICIPAMKGAVIDNLGMYIYDRLGAREGQKFEELYYVNEYSEDLEEEYIDSNISPNNILLRVKCFYTYEISGEYYNAELYSMHTKYNGEELNLGEDEYPVFKTKNGKEVLYRSGHNGDYGGKTFLAFRVDGIYCIVYTDIGNMNPEDFPDDFFDIDIYQLGDYEIEYTSDNTEYIDVDAPKESAASEADI